MKKLIFAIFLCFGLLIFIQVYLHADEKITLSTYYPAPYGEYRTLAVGDAYPAPDPGGTTDLVVEGNVGIGTTNPVHPLYIYTTTDDDVGITVENPNSAFGLLTLTPNKIELYPDDAGQGKLVIYSSMNDAVSVLSVDTVPTSSANSTVNIGGRLHVMPNMDEANVFNISATASPNPTILSVDTTSGGKVGIGTTAPSYKLHVECNDNVRAGYFNNTYQTGVSYGIYSSTANNSGTQYGVYARTSGTGAGYAIAGRSSGGTSSNYGVYGMADGTGSPGNFGVYGTASGGTTNWAGYFNGNTAVMNGNVGIGTTTPTAPLHINGLASGWDGAGLPAGRNWGQLVITPTDHHDGGIQIFAGDSNEVSGPLWGWGLVAGWGGPGGRINLFRIFDFAAGTERLVIRNNGNIGIGTTNPQSKLHVNGGMRAVLSDIGAANPPVLWDGGPGGTNIIGYDIAELFETSEATEPADVLIIGKDGKLQKSNTPYDSRIAGIVSVAPAILFEGKELSIAPDNSLPQDPMRPKVALVGKVLCKVASEGGPIYPGDLLVTSSVPGHAMKANPDNLKAGMILGRAIGTLEKEEKGQIVVLIALQ